MNRFSSVLRAAVCAFAAVAALSVCAGGRAQAEEFSLNGPSLELRTVQFCRGCGKALRVGHLHEGQTFVCPGCGLAQARMSDKLLNRLVLQVCQACQKPFDVNDLVPRGTVACPLCGETQKVLPEATLTPLEEGLRKKLAESAWAMNDGSSLVGIGRNVDVPLPGTEPNPTPATPAPQLSPPLPGAARGRVEVPTIEAPTSAPIPTHALNAAGVPSAPETSTSSVTVEKQPDAKTVNGQVASAQRGDSSGKNNSAKNADSPKPGAYNTGAQAADKNNSAGKKDGGVAGAAGGVAGGAVGGDSARGLSTLPASDNLPYERVRAMSDSQKIVATVNGEPVTLAQLDRRFSLALDDEKRRLGPSAFSPEGAGKIAASMPRLRASALDELVHETLLLQEAAKKGVDIPQEEISAALAQQPSSLGGRTKAEATEQLRRTFILRRMLKENSRSANVTPAQVKEYFTRHRDRFAEPETLRLRSLVVFKERAGREDTRPAADIVAEAAAYCRKGGDFGETAGRYSEAIPMTAGGMFQIDGISQLPAGAFAAPVRRALAGLAEGAVSAPIDVGSAYALIKLEKRSGGGTPRLEDVQERVTAELREQASAERAESYLKALREKAEIQVF